MSARRKCSRCDATLFAGRCPDCEPVKKAVQVQAVKAIVCPEPDYDTKRKQDMVDYGCYGREAEIMRNMSEYH